VVRFLGGRLANCRPLSMDRLLKAFDEQFLLIDKRSRVLLEQIPDDKLFVRPRELPSMAMFSCGESILRSAAMVEKTFGGITTRLWDDPFEWTLPETLNNQERIIEYLAEVDATRERAFCCFSDDALTKYVSSPAGEFVLLSVLLDALVRASDYHGRAAATSKMFSDGSTVRFII